MHLLIWNLPPRCAASEVRRFLENELGNYVSAIEVYGAGTPDAYADATLTTDLPYIGEVIAQRLSRRRLRDTPLRARASASGDASTRLH
ncbi:hypothetical protein [Caballeronia telluris]|jgi:hypothetical protein|uniref:RNA-binding protein n=1 Tax=Caballeronia telluris TaxID=326475 RepID=A0A158JTC3_9BURK|nr:hypothetical protein [Caballeronia telluris]SAL71925.1 hypothetical protein AWB66_04600 [Caballeronia telluris]